MYSKYLLAMFIGVLTASCTSIPASQYEHSKTINTNNYKDQLSKSNSQQSNIFTYPFDPKKPQIDMAISGKLLVKNNCLFLMDGNGEMVTPVFPSGVSQWDEPQGIVHIYGKQFPIGSTIRTNGGYFDYSPKAQFDPFESKADPSCLKDKRLILGTKFD